MSQQSISDQPGSVQALVRDAVDTAAATRIDDIVQASLRDIAIELFARDHKRNVERTNIQDIHLLGGPPLVRSYLEDAQFVLRLRDADRHRGAVYYATNAAVPCGIGSLNLDVRLAELDHFEVALRAYRDALTNRAQPDVMARLGRLLEADRAAIETKPARAEGAH